MNGTANKILNIPTTKKRPTPTETVIISTLVSTLGTLVASTCRSGSAIVTITPRIKLITTISESFFVLVSFAPMLVPIIDIDRSTPILKSPIPAIIMTVPMIKERSRPLSIGIRNKHKAITISDMGRTDFVDSTIFSFNKLCLSTAPPNIFYHIYFIIKNLYTNKHKYFI